MTSVAREKDDDRLQQVPVLAEAPRGAVRQLPAGNPALSDLDREGIAESVIQRFETCYDCLWKVLKRYLTEELGLAETPNSPRHIFRLANENALFDAPVEQWFRYLRARIDTSHDYDGEKANACLALIPDFIDDAIALYRAVSGEPWG